jgi:hypothetical protein
MTNKLLILISFLTVTGCIKETYDMDKLSKRAHLSPTLAVSAVNEDISFSDLIKPSDTVVFDEDNFVRLVFRDTVINEKMEDYYDLNDMVSFNKIYQMGNMNIAPFSGTIRYTLDQISQRLSPALRAQFLVLDGTTSIFPSFPGASMTELVYSSFSTFEYAIMSEGSIDISVKNNLSAPISGISVRLYNTSGHTSVGGEALISLVNPGQTGTTSINIANATIRNSVTAAVIIGSPGTGTTPVPIDLDVNNVEVSIKGRDLWVKSGRAIVPAQNISALGDDNIDTVTFDPGSGVEVTLIKVIKGNISYSVRVGSQLTSTASLEFPTALRNGSPITESVTVNPNSTFNGNISVDNSIIDLSTIATTPYNMVLVEHNITVSSQNIMINFNSTDEVEIDLKLLNPEFDYVKGYFGQETRTFNPDTIDLGINDILDKISGDLLFSRPSVKINYANSFAIPVEINLKGTGYKADETVDLGLDPFNISYPAAPGERDKEGVFIIDKTNSSLPALVSMPPEMIRISGSAKMNPLGNSGSRDNYIFGDSRLFGSLEVEIPLEFRIIDLQFADTVDNFMRNEEIGGDSPAYPEDFEFLRIDIKAENGFPVGVSLSIILYDSGTKLNRKTIEAEDILEPAPVDNNGRVTEPKVSATSIDIKRDFWTSVNSADKVIFKFSMKTTGDGSRDVKIYSDYKIGYKASLVLKPDIKLNF